MFPYEELKAARARADALAQRIAACNHPWQTSSPQTVTVDQPTYDPWAGWGYTSKKVYGMQWSRHCPTCGLRQTRTELAPGDRSTWENA